MSLANTIIYGSKADVEAALAQGADVSEYDEYGFNPIVEAAIMNKTDIAELLLDRGCPVNLPDTLGRTALHWACDNHNLPLCRLLLERGANPNAYSTSNQPVLTLPYLRNQIDLKNLLYQYGASLHFVQDYVNIKLIGHRFSLEGQNYVVNAAGDFLLVDFEGFMFEFTASLIEDSLRRFINNYAARHLQHYTKKITRLIESLNISAELIKYQQFSIKREHYEKKINQLLSHDLLVIPIAYRGHAITGILFQDLYIKCDRGEYGRDNAPITVYKIRNPKKFNKALIKKLLYVRNTEQFVHYGMNDLCGLEPIWTLPMELQISGNCSWANVEATIPAMLFLLFLEEIATINKKDLKRITQYALEFFHQWREWDQDRAIDECVQSFYSADKKRRATKVQLLTNILVNRCIYNVPKHVSRAEKMLPILREPEHEYIFNTYIKAYTRDKTFALGKNLKHLLDIAVPK